MDTNGAGIQLELAMLQSDVSDMQHSDDSPSSDIQVRRFCLLPYVLCAHSIVTVSLCFRILLNVKVYFVVVLCENDIF